MFYTLYNRGIRQQQPKETNMTAAQLLNPTCPANSFFVKWLGGKEPTKRQARKFLQQFPNFAREKQNNTPNIGGDIFSQQKHR